MTERLYEADVYMREFQARVLSSEKRGETYEVILDQTAFYPEGGGQSGDRGTLSFGMGSGKAERLGASSVQVLDTRERGEDIVLVCDGQVPQGAEVTGVLNWQYRFDRMQNHSGEHIVSGLIHRKYGCNNVGFHMSEDRMTIDLDGEITREGLREIEEEANAIVWQNQEISTAVYTEAEAEKVDFRSKKELHGAIRVVTIPGADVCACCGTHVKHTGEIGSIRLIAH